MSDKLKKGCVVYMKADSGMKGYGNPQCVSWVSHELGELSLYGHNEHYKTYDVREIIEYPESPTPPQLIEEEGTDLLEWVRLQEYHPASTNKGTLVGWLQPGRSVIQSSKGLYKLFKNSKTSNS